MSGSDHDEVLLSGVSSPQLPPLPDLDFPQADKMQAMLPQLASAADPPNSQTDTSHDADSFQQSYVRLAAQAHAAESPAALSPPLASVSSHDAAPSNSARGSPTTTITPNPGFAIDTAPSQQPSNPPASPIIDALSLPPLSSSIAVPVPIRDESLSSGQQLSLPVAISNPNSQSQPSIESSSSSSVSLPDADVDIMSVVSTPASASANRPVRSSATNHPLPQQHARHDPHAFHPTNTVYFVPPDGSVAQFPPQCRLFIGNIATERTSKDQVARIFAKYGNILEISFKSSYGFVQFDSPEACQLAIQNENHRILSDMKIDLKISKDKAPPGQNRRRDDDRRGRNDVPDRATRPNAMRGAIERGGDTYDRRREFQRDNGPGGRPFDRRDDHVDRRFHDRDHDRGRNYDRDVVHRRNRSRDSRDSRSPPPPSSLSSRQHGNNNHQRHPPAGGHGREGLAGDVPRHRTSASNRHTNTNKPPDCRIIAINDIERGFLMYVENAIRHAGLTCNTLHFTPHMHLNTVVNQMRADGSLAVIFLEKNRQVSNTVAAQIFNPGFPPGSGSNGSVTELDHVSIDQVCGVVVQMRVLLGCSNGNPSLSLSQSNGGGGSSSVGPGLAFQQPFVQPSLSGLVSQQQDSTVHPVGMATSATVPATVTPDVHLANALAALVAQSQSQGTPIDPQMLLALANAQRQQFQQQQHQQKQQPQQQQMVFQQPTSPLQTGLQQAPFTSTDTHTGVKSMQQPSTNLAMLLSSLGNMGNSTGVRPVTSSNVSMGGSHQQQQKPMSGSVSIGQLSGLPRVPITSYASGGHLSGGLTGLLSSSSITSATTPSSSVSGTVTASSTSNTVSGTNNNNIAAMLSQLNASSRLLQAIQSVKGGGGSGHPVQRR